MKCTVCNSPMTELKTKYKCTNKKCNLTYSKCIKQFGKADLRKKQPLTWMDKLTLCGLSIMAKLSMKFTDMLYRLMENNSRGY